MQWYATNDGYTSSTERVKIMDGDDVVATADGQFVVQVVKRDEHHRVTLKSSFAGELTSFAGELIPECVTSFARVTDRLTIGGASAVIHQVMYERARCWLVADVQLPRAMLPEIT